MKYYKMNCWKSLCIIPAVFLIAASGCQDRHIRGDVTGKYILDNCRDSESGKNKISNNVATVIQLKKMSDTEYQLGYIGGSASGTKLNCRVDGRGLRGDLGDVSVRYSFGEDLNSITYSSYGLECRYTKLTNQNR